MIWGNTNNVKNINSWSCLIFLAVCNAESAAQCLQIYLHDRQLVVLLVSLICILQNLQQMYIHDIEWPWRTHNCPRLAEEAANLVRGYFRAAHFWNWTLKIESFSTRPFNLGSEFIAASSSHWCIPGTVTVCSCGLSYKIRALSNYCLMELVKLLSLEHWLKYWV